MRSTYWGHCRLGEGEDVPWELQQREGRGLVAVASRDFRAGELIVRERALTSTAGWHPFNEGQVKTLNADLQKLSEEEKKAFFEMENVFPECDEAAGIYMTNSFDMTSSSSSTSPACGMYLAIARLNHSCRPNAQQTHIPETKEEVLYASKPIKRGEELCDCYIELRQSTSDRRKELNKYYRFTCNCEACSKADAGLTTMKSDSHVFSTLENQGSPNEMETELSNLVENATVSSPDASDNIVNAKYQSDDDRRIAAMALDKKMMQLAEEGQVQKALHCALEIIEVLDDPRNEGWGERYLADTYLCVFHFSCSLYREGYDLRKWRKMAEEYVCKAYSINLKLQGPESPDTCQSLSYVQNIDNMLNGD